jgi:general secretion pathway protein G
MSAANIMKLKFRGFSLVEVLLVIMIVGILAGGVMLAFGSRSEKAEATVMMSDLDAVKNAMLAYSMEHRTRRTDGLDGWGSAVWESTNPALPTIRRSLDKYLDSNLGRGDAASRFAKLKVRYANGIEVGFDDFPASNALKDELTKKVHDVNNAANGMYSGSPSVGGYSLWIRVR